MTFDPSLLQFAASGALGFLPDRFKTVPLADGTLGFEMRAVDDCYAACLATVLQTDSVPRFDIDGRLRKGWSEARVEREVLAEIKAFLDDWELREVLHDPPCWGHDRWIGVVPVNGGFAQDHCLVMSKDQVLHEPGGEHTPADFALARVMGARLKQWRPEDVAYGITFEALED